MVAGHVTDWPDLVYRQAASFPSWTSRVRSPFAPLDVTPAEPLTSGYPSTSDGAVPDSSECRKVRRRSPVGAPGRRSDGPYRGTHPLQVTRMRTNSRALTDFRCPYEPVASGQGAAGLLRAPITTAAKKVIYQPAAPARDPVRFPRWRIGLICSSMRNFLAGVIVTIFLSGAGCRPMPGAHRRSPGSGPPP